MPTVVSQYYYSKKSKEIIFQNDFHDLWPLVAKILTFRPQLRNLQKESAPEPDSEVQIPRSGLKNAKDK